MKNKYYWVKFGDTWHIAEKVKYGKYLLCGVSDTYSVFDFDEIGDEVVQPEHIQRDLL